MFGLPFNKYIVYGVLALLATAFLTAYVLMWKASIRREALLEFNNNQLERTIKDQETFITNLKTLNESQKKIIAETQKRNEEISKQLADIEIYLNSEEAKKNDRPSSVVIRETIRRLSGQKP